MALQVDLNSVMRLNVLEPSTIIHSSLALFDSRSESPLRGFLIQQPYYNDCYNVDLQEQFGIMHIFVRTWYMGNKGTIDMRDWTIIDRYQPDCRSSGDVGFMSACNRIAATESHMRLVAVAGA